MTGYPECMEGGVAPCNGRAVLWRRESSCGVTARHAKLQALPHHRQHMHNTASTAAPPTRKQLQATQVLAGAQPWGAGVNGEGGTVAVVCRLKIGHQHIHWPSG